MIDRMITQSEFNRLLAQVAEPHSGQYPVDTIEWFNANCHYARAKHYANIGTNRFLLLEFKDDRDQMLFDLKYKT